MTQNFDFSQIDTPEDKTIESHIRDDIESTINRVNDILNTRHKELLLSNDHSETQTQELDSLIRKILQQDIKEYRVDVINKILYAILANLTGIDILQPLMDNKEITEIEVMDWDRVYYVDFENRKLSNIKFPSPEAYENFVVKMVDRSGHNLSPENPIVDFALVNKTRVNIVGPWATVNGTYYITMRKPPTAVKQVSIDELLKWNAFTSDMVDLMQLNSDGKMNVLLSGETNSGKTTIIRLLMGMLRPENMEKVILLQDTPEIESHDKEQIIVLLKTINRKVDPITFYELLKSTLRMNPDRTWIGEIRGKEAAEMIESNLAGARGTLASGHADSPANMIMRLVIIMYRAGFDLSEHIIRTIIHNSVDFIYQTMILPDGSKKIVEMTEILPLDVAEQEGCPSGLRKIFEYRLEDISRDENGVITSIKGHHWMNPEGLSNYRRKKLLKHGVRTPDKFGGVPSWS